jgi:hypothetical protein
MLEVRRRQNVAILGTKVATNNTKVVNYSITLTLISKNKRGCRRGKYFNTSIVINLSRQIIQHDV